MLQGSKFCLLPLGGQLVHIRRLDLFVADATHGHRLVGNVVIFLRIRSFAERLSAFRLDVRIRGRGGKAMARCDDLPTVG